MKKNYTLLLLLASMASFAQFTEPFMGTGTLITNGWEHHNGTMSGELTIASGSLVYSTIGTEGNKVAFSDANSEDVNKSVGTAITTTAYYSAIVNFPNTTDLAVNTATGDYPISLGKTAGTSVTILPARIYFRLGSAANTFNIGVLNNSGGTPVAPSYVATDFPINTTVFVVVKYVLGTNTASLFINPALDTTEPAATTSNNTGTNAAPAEIASLALREGSNTGNVQFDAIRVADNWAYVTTSVLGRTEFDGIAGLQIYPNPAKTFLNVTSTNFEEKEVEIYNVLGKVVLSSKVINSQVNVSNLAAGLYVVKVTEAGKTSSRKLVIE
jgi:hypothetical protein